MEIILNENYELIGVNSKDNNTLDWADEILQNSLGLVNEFLHNSFIYLGDIYAIVTELYDYIKNIIEGIYIVKFKHPMKFN
jgi:hypothetical protein